MNTRSLQLLATLVLLALALFLGWRGLLLEAAPARITWETESEVDTVGFHVFRATSEEGPYERVSSEIIGSRGDPFSGSDYVFVDRTVEPNQTYYYRLEELESTGNFNRLPDTVVVKGSYQPVLLTTFPLLLALILVWLLPKPAKRAPLHDPA